MEKHRSTAVLDHPAEARSTLVLRTGPGTGDPPAGELRGVEQTEGPQAVERHGGPRRWSDPDERLVLWGLLGFLLLGLYAAVCVAIGMWMTP